MPTPLLPLVPIFDALCCEDVPVVAFPPDFPYFLLLFGLLLLTLLDLPPAGCLLVPLLLEFLLLFPDDPPLFVPELPCLLLPPVPVAPPLFPGFPGPVPGPSLIGGLPGG